MMSYRRPKSRRDGLAAFHQQNSPREIDDSEFSAAASGIDGDEYIVFGFPPGEQPSPLNGGTKSRTRIWKKQIPKDSNKMETTLGIPNGNVVDDSHCNGFTELYIGDDDCEKRADKPALDGTRSVAPDHNRTSQQRLHVDTDLRIANHGDKVYSSTAQNTPGKRSAIPVPVWTNAAKQDAINASLSPGSTANSTGNGPMTRQTGRRINGHVTNDVRSGNFSRRDVTRSSMFERGSRRHQPANKTPTGHGNKLHPGHRTEAIRRSGRPRSTSPSSRNTCSVQSSPVVVSISKDSQRSGVPIGAGWRNAVSYAQRQRLGSKPKTTDDENNNVIPLNGREGATSPVSNDEENLMTMKDNEDETSSKHSNSNIWDSKVIITDVTDIISNLSSSEWPDRRNGLASLQNMLRSDALLTPADLKKVTELFTRMFHDPQTKVFSIFAEVLVDFVNSHAADLDHWLQVALPRLFLKLSADLRGSICLKVEAALKAVRDCFEIDQQIDVLSEFMIEQAQTQNVKMKESVLDYLHELILEMEPQDLVNSPALQKLLFRVAMWLADPQSVEARNLAEAVIAAMFNVNSPELVLAMSTQPKGIQVRKKTRKKKKVPTATLR